MDDLIDGLEAAMTSRVEADFAAVCATDLHYEDPLTIKPLQGTGALTTHLARLDEPFPDARVEKTGERLVSGDGRFVAAPVKLTGTHRGELEGLPATKKFVVVHAVFYCELDEARERLWRIRGFFDLYGAAMQLGILPQPGSMGEKALLMLRGFGVRARGG